MKYEICYLVGEANEAKLPEIKSAVEKIVTQEGGDFFGIETLDKRKLAYPVEKQIRGFYVTRRFELPEEGEEGKSPLQEMTKKLNLYNDILRFLVIKADKLPELKQREIPVRAEKSERRFDRGRGQAPASFRRAAAPKPEPKAPEAKEEVKAEAAAAPEVSTQAKEESIDQKLDEILNI